MYNTVTTIKEKFTCLFQTNPYTVAQAPGRAEIIGNHTDYNQGYALGAAILQSTYAAVSLRDDDKILAFSENFDTQINKIALTDITSKNGNNWTNYVKAVTYELSKKKPVKKGFNMYITSNVPSSGGVSSSAA